MNHERCDPPIGYNIAIIGMAGCFPEADSVHQFFDNLCRARDSVRELSIERKVRTSLSLDDDFQLCGYIEEIDSFDYAFFGIAKREAQNMAPEQRLLLQVVYQAVENAGYDPNILNGVCASVYAGDTTLEYSRLSRSFDPTMLMGSHVSATVGRIARTFGLRGPAAMVDSSCSSSLFAVKLAMNDLRLGEVDLALVCGVNLNLFPDRRNGEQDIGIRSADGRTRCFSAEASGTGSGEAVACIVLKGLDQAVRDGDLIHAVIKTVAANHVARRAHTLTAPDSTAQAEVIQQAWEKAGIDPTTISYIEAHGTATRLGDPIEIEAIDHAFGAVTHQKRFCAVSSVKSNIGHTWSAAGIVGLIKAVLSLKHRVLFPNLHCANLSPLIDFADSAVVVTRELASWNPICGVRRAGVSSFGIMGTNVHAVLEEAPAQQDACRCAEAPVGRYWIPISAKSVGSLEANVRALKEWIDGRPELSLDDIQHTLVCGRGHYSHRFCVTSDHTVELSKALAVWRNGGPQNDYVGSASVATVLVLSGQFEVSIELTQALRRDYPQFDILYAQCERAAGADNEATCTTRVAFQYAFYGLLCHIGLEIHHLVSEGAGKHIVDMFSGRLALREGVQRALVESNSQSADLDVRIDRVLEKLKRYQRVLFVDTGTSSATSRAIIARGRAGYGVVSLNGRADAFVDYLRELYLGGANWQWRMTAGGGRRIELPSYQFQRSRCWMENVSVPSMVESSVNTPCCDSAAKPGDVLERVLAIWKDVLGLEDLSAQASFFDHGGDSISGTQLINRLQTLFGIELAQDAIFEHGTPNALARRIIEVRCAQRPGMSVSWPAPEEEYFATSPTQLHVWLASQFEGGSVAFHLSRSFRLAGTLETNALRSALGAIAERHDSLRTVFAFGEGKLLQRIVPVNEFSVPLEVHRLDEPLPDEHRLTDMIRGFVSRPFNLEHGSLFRAQLLCFRQNEHVLTYSTHHIVADGWSLDLLTRDLFAFYASFSRQAPLALPQIRVKCRDLYEQMATRTDRRRAAAAEYWLSRFDGEIPSIDLPRGSARRGASFAGTYRKYFLPDQLYDRLRRYSQKAGGTVFVSVVSAFAALFSRYTEDGELVLGTSVAGRTAEAVEPLVGMLVQTLPLRLRVNLQGTFRALFDHVRSIFTEALRHINYPYEELIQELQRRGRAHAPTLFEVLIEFQQFAAPDIPPLDPISGCNLRVSPIEVNLETSVFPLNIMLSEQTGRLSADIRFDTQLFDTHTINQLWASFVSLLDAALARPDDPLERLQFLSESEEHHVRTRGYRTLDFDPTIRVHKAIEGFAARTPTAVSLSCGDDHRTYEQLNARANQIARFFVHQCQVGPENVVALVMDRSILMVEAILALWKCGAAYLPINPRYPPSFIRAILDSSKVQVVAFDPSQLAEDFFQQIRGGRQVFPLDAKTANEENSANPDFPINGSTLAYVIYTSGSTGVQKGAMVEHLGMLNHLHAKIADLSLSERSVVVQNASNSFDISVWQMFAAPFVGGRTTIFSEELQLDPLRLAARLDHEGVTVLEVVPSYLQTMLEAWDQAGRTISLECLEFLLVTGEPASPQLVNRWIRQFPNKAVVNAYGPTEASDDVTHHVMTAFVETDYVPLGRPIPNTFIYVLDEHQRLCPPGVKGEICVSGICVGRGYLNAPEQSARVFVTDPFQPGQRMYRTGDIGRWTSAGTLEYFGRKDSQLKVRGFRVELGEIESRLCQCPATKTAVVIAKKDTTGASELWAFVVLASGGSLSQCRDFLSRRLPQHMVPAHFIDLDRLPLNFNGKVDRRALQRIHNQRMEGERSSKPTSEVEALLMQIWEQVLGCDRIQLTDRFFDLGGNSLRAIQVLSRLRSLLGVDLPLETLFQYSTIAELATRVSTTQSRTTDFIPSLGRAGVYEISAAQKLLLSIEDNYLHRDAFNRNDLYRLRSGELDPARLEAGFARLVERHESLRTTYDNLMGTPVQIVHEPGAIDLPFAFHDFSTACDAQGAANQFVERRIRTPFQIAKDPLVRVDLIRLNSEASLLLVSMHQLISDGRSAEIFFEEWLDLYDSSDTGREPTLASPRLQFKDIARWRNERMTPDRLVEHRQFWHDELDGASSFIPLVVDYVRPAVLDFAGERLCLDFPRALSDRIAALARENRVTEFLVAHCALTLLLASETGLTDLTIGTYTRGRNHVELEDQIGFFINTIPLRFRVIPGESVQRMIKRAQNTALQAIQHEEYPYEWIMKDLGWRRGVDHTPLFDVMIAMGDTETDRRHCTARKHCMTLERQELPRRAKEADQLYTFQRAADRLEVALTYNTKLFSPLSIRRRLGTLQTILEAMVDNRPVVESVTSTSFHQAQKHGY